MPSRAIYLLLLGNLLLPASASAQQLTRTEESRLRTAQRYVAYARRYIASRNGYYAHRYIGSAERYHGYLARTQANHPQVVALKKTIDDLKKQAAGLPRTLPSRRGPGARPTPRVNPYEQAARSREKLTAVSDDRWKEILADFERRWETEDERQQDAALRMLGRANRPEGVRKLIGLLAATRKMDSNSARRRGERLRRELSALQSRMTKVDNYLNNLRKRLGLSKAYGNPDYRNASALRMKLYQRMRPLRDELRKLDEQLGRVDRLRLAIADALGWTQDAKALEVLCTEGLGHTRWEVQVCVLQGLGMTGQHSAWLPVRRVIGSSDPRVASAAIAATAELGDKGAAPAIQKQLEHASWQVRVAAVAALERFAAVGAIGALVEAMLKEDGHLLEDLSQALEKITGFSFGASPKLWKSWYDNNKDRIEEVVAARRKLKKKAAADQVAGGQSVTFYGIGTRSKRLVFVIDTSGSMSGPAGSYRGSVGPRTKRGAQDSRVTKMDVAKKELARAIGALSNDAVFNIIFFGNDVGQYKAHGLVRATRSNKRTCLRWIEKTLRPRGGTNIFDALSRGFSISSGGKDPFEHGIDTIFFLTDGTPTSGRITSPSEILRRITLRNRLRQIKIHAIAIGGSNKEFLKTLATRNHGQFAHHP